MTDVCIAARVAWRFCAENFHEQLSITDDLPVLMPASHRRVLPSASPSPAPVLQAGYEPKPCSTAVGGEHPATISTTSEAVSQSSGWARETASKGV